MSPGRAYSLGRRQESVDRTRSAILAAARDLLASADGPRLSTGAVARRAGVSRITVYNRFGSKDGLLRELAQAARRQGTAPEAAGGDDPRGRLRQRIADACSMWASDPALFRGLPAGIEIDAANGDRALAELLAASGDLRPGCSLKEAEDVIGALTSFPVFDRLHRDGRRTQAAVTDILVRLAAGILS